MKDEGSTLISRRAIAAFMLSCFSSLRLAFPRRKSYRESCVLLQQLGGLDQAALPKLPGKRPSYHDPGPSGVRIFRTLLENRNFANLTLPRTFFRRSEIKKVSFENTDLSESTLCWNDFSDVNFDKATLAKSDLRAATFVRVQFGEADLSGTDLRRSSFKACSFVGADLSGAVATRKQQISLNLSKRQLVQVSWFDDDGDEPGGG